MLTGCMLCMLNTSQLLCFAPCRQIEDPEHGGADACMNGGAMITGADIYQQEAYCQRGEAKCVLVGTLARVYLYTILSCQTGQRYRYPLHSPVIGFGH